MKKNIFLFTCIFFTLFSVRATLAQDSLHSRFGISFGIADNIQSANFTNLPGIPGCCANFTSGDGSGFAASLLYEYPINDMVSIGARLGYIDHSATLTSSAGKTQLFIKGYENLGEYNRTIDLVASSYGIEPRVGIRVIKGLIVNAGLRIGFVSSAKFIQRDTASEGTFADSSGKDTQSGVRNQHSGNLPNASSALLHGIFSIAYEFPLGHNYTTFFVPEITYTPAFSDLVKGLTWKTNAIIFALAMKFSL